MDRDPNLPLAPYDQSAPDGTLLRHAAAAAPIARPTLSGSGVAADPGVANPELVSEMETREVLEPQYLIYVHNDDVTPFEYVMTILGRVFLLSEEIAEHVAMTAHSEGRAVVMVRPRDEAKRLIAVAHSRARMDGYPLAFSMEPES
jgi:ATP-dependent Clp protease adaptor protein ClpS